MAQAMAGLRGNPHDAYDLWFEDNFLIPTTVSVDDVGGGSGVGRVKRDLAMLIKVLEEMVPSDTPKVLRTHIAILPRFLQSSTNSKILTPAIRTAFNEYGASSRVTGQFLTIHTRVRSVFCVRWFFISLTHTIFFLRRPCIR